MKLGCDPEIICTDPWQQAHSIIGKLGGTKQKPLPVPFGAVQEDNVNAEFNIVPASTFEEFDMHICKVMSKLAEMVFQHKLILSTLASALFPQDELTGPALISGCEPDFNAWDMDFNVPPQYCSSRLRSAGGHIHIQCDDFDGYLPNTTDVHNIERHFLPNTETDNIHDGFYLVRAFDYRLGVQSVLLDKDTERKKLYGKAGCFRPKPYGIEYRTLSNFWIFTSEYRKWVWDESLIVANNYKKWKIKETSALGSDIEYCINHNDKELAKKIIRSYDV